MRRRPDPVTSVAVLITVVLASAFVAFDPFRHRSVAVTGPTTRVSIGFSGGDTPGVPPPEHQIDGPDPGATGADQSHGGGVSVPPPADGVLYDGKWSVTEGVWAVGAEIPDPPSDVRVLTSTAHGQALSVFTPALYGTFRVRLELHASAPPVPAWCQDAFEASLRVVGDVALVGFEDSSPPLGLPVGSYRARFCVRGLDQVPEDPPTDGAIAPGRYLFQFWPAPMAPDRTLFAHSAFGRHPGSAGGGGGD